MAEPRRTTTGRAGARRRAAGSGLALAALLGLGPAGCQGVGPIGRWRTARDEVLAKPPTAAEAGADENLMTRLFSPGTNRNLAKSALANPADPTTIKPDPAGEAELKAAEALFEQGKLPEAEAALARLDRKFNGGGLATRAFALDSRPKGDGSPATNASAGGGLFGGKKEPVRTTRGERAMYLLGETQYQRGRFVAAVDTFDRLMSTYPGSRYLDKVAEREFAIGQGWLAAVDPKAAPEKREGWGDRFNGRMPLADVGGHALRVLEHVRHYDPTGPLADQAALKIADYYFSRADYENASAYYDQLIAEHPKSKLLQQAHMASIDAKLRSYLGPDYDASGLDQARELIKRTRSTFPERQASTVDRLEHDLALIDDQQAEITFKRGEFYRSTGYPGAAELCFGEIRARWPKSPWAEKAKAQLDTLAKAPRQKVLPSKIMGRPGSPDPYTMGQSAGSMGASPGSMMGGLPGGGGFGP